MSLSDDPVKEIKVAKEILKDCNLYKKSPTSSSMPYLWKNKNRLDTYSKRGRRIFTRI